MARFRWARFWILGLLVGGFVLGMQPQTHAVVDAQATIDALIPRLESYTGYRLTRPVVVSNSDADRSYFIGRDVDRTYARTVFVYRNSAGAVVDASSYAEADTCLIVLARYNRLADDNDKIHVLAHELGHCYQRDRLQSLRTLPEWLWEGSAEWMGQMLAPASNAGRARWPKYLTETLPLTGRDYDAVGFFVHLEYQGAGVWDLLDRFFDPSGGDFPAASDALFDRLLNLAGVRDRFLETWPMGLERNSGAGRDWDTDGPNITGDRRAAGSLSAPGGAAIAATTQYLWTLPIPAGQIVTVSVENGYGAIRIDRDTERFHGSFSRRYCQGDSCQCEDGSSPPGVESISTDQVIIAATADFTPGQIRIETEEPPCEREEPSSGSGDSGDRPHGSSFGDPHIITYDGYRYSFQTVGEFLLSKTTDGHFQVQARQTQVPGRRNLSLNTAVAMQVGGQRVAVYSQNFPDGSNPLWVDGLPIPLNNAVFPLPGGGRVENSGRFYTITWPTGESVALRSIQAGGASFLNITPYVTRSEAGQLTGLLGDLNGNPGDDLRDRSGQQIPTQDVYAPVTQLINRVIDIPLPLNQFQTAFFNQLYRQFGDSWRISQAESLFDYGPGQSTETFTDRSFPSRYPSLVGVAPAQIQAATRQCQEANIDVDFMAGCVFDIAATGESGFLEAAANAVVNVVVERAVDRVIDEVRDVIPIPIPRWPF
ncbi:hypothetical protein C7271_04650 [filamentous cyanobacterium CCP5]|nr:hypothetical protein C7271_04650 [filamentous cyanobacterium CCP5]